MKTKIEVTQEFYINRMNEINIIDNRIEERRKQIQRLEKKEIS